VNAIKWVATWIARIWRAAWAALKILAKKLLDNILEGFKKLGEFVNAVWTAIKTGVAWLWKKLQELLKWLWKQFVKFFMKFLDWLPKFQYLHIGQIYIRCLTDPKHCDHKPPKHVTFALCFKGFSTSLCLSGQIPTLDDVGTWITKHILGPIAQFFQKIFGFEHKKVCQPAGIKKRKVEMTYNKPTGPATSKISKRGVKNIDQPQKDPKTGEYKFHSKKSSAGTKNLPSGVKCDNQKIKRPNKVYHVKATKDGNVKRDNITDIIKDYESIVKKRQALYDKAKKNLKKIKKLAPTLEKIGGNIHSQVTQQIRVRQEKVDKAKKALDQAEKQLADAKSGKGTNVKYTMQGKNAYKKATKADYQRPNKSGEEAVLWAFRRNGWPSHLELHRDSIPEVLVEFDQNTKKKHEKIISDHQAWRAWLSDTPTPVVQELADEVPVYPVAVPLMKKGVEGHHPRWDYPHVQEESYRLAKEAHPHVKKFDHFLGAAIIPTSTDPENDGHKPQTEEEQRAELKKKGIPYHWDRVSEGPRVLGSTTHHDNIRDQQRRSNETWEQQGGGKMSHRFEGDTDRFLDPPEHPEQEKELKRLQAEGQYMYMTDREPMTQSDSSQMQDTRLLGNEEESGQSLDAEIIMDIEGYDEAKHGPKQIPNLKDDTLVNLFRLPPDLDFSELSRGELLQMSHGLPLASHTGLKQAKFTQLSSSGAAASRRKGKHSSPSPTPPPLQRQNGHKEEKDKDFKTVRQQQKEDNKVEAKKNWAKMRVYGNNTKVDFDKPPANSGEAGKGMTDKQKAWAGYVTNGHFHGSNKDMKDFAYCTCLNGNPATMATTPKCTRNEYPMCLKCDKFYHIESSKVAAKAEGSRRRKEARPRRVSWE
jgi:hypothetical protein